MRTVFPVGVDVIQKCVNVGATAVKVNGLNQ